MHEDAFELLARDAKVLEIDDHLSDLRQIAHRPELLGDLLADIVRKKVIQGLKQAFSSSLMQTSHDQMLTFLSTSSRSK